MLTTKINGFTLVEIAIIQVIVGLLIGGILKGSEMMTYAKLKRVERDSAGISAAMFSYQDRYLAQPGDDGNALDRFDIYTAAADNGNGDGVIDGLWSPANTTDETAMFWKHLRAAGLIPGGGIDTSQPTNAYGGLIGIRDGTLGISGHVIVFGQIEGVIACVLEVKHDDSSPNTGRIQSGQASGTPIDMDMDTDLVGSGSYIDSQRYNMGFKL
jgi:hypothetical protein